MVLSTMLAMKITHAVISPFATTADTVRRNEMRSNLELNDYEFIAMNNLKRAALALSDGDYNHVEACVGEVLECMYKVNK